MQVRTAFWIAFAPCAAPLTAAPPYAVTHLNALPPTGSG
jgi:hypothetical protein